LGKGRENVGMLFLIAGRGEFRIIIQKRKKKKKGSVREESSIISEVPFGRGRGEP